MDDAVKVRPQVELNPITIPELKYAGGDGAKLSATVVLAAASIGASAGVTEPLPGNDVASKTKKQPAVEPVVPINPYRNPAYALATRLELIDEETCGAIVIGP